MKVDTINCAVPISLRKDIESLKIHPSQPIGEILAEAIKLLKSERELVSKSKNMKPMKITKGLSGQRSCFYCGFYKGLLLEGVFTQENIGIFESDEGAFICLSCLKKGLELFNLNEEVKNG